MEERIHELDDADRTCPSCGGGLDEWPGQFEESREVDMYERRFVELHHKRKKYRCKCGGCVETAPGPTKLIPGGRYSVDIAISIAVAKYADHMPLHRLVGALSRQGLTIDSQTLWDQIDALARVLSPVHDALQAAVLAAPVIGADETYVLGSPSSEVAALFYSIIEPVKLVGVDPCEYLRDATHAALKGESIPLPGDRDHSLA